MKASRLLLTSVAVLIFCLPTFPLQRDSDDTLSHIIKVNVSALSINEINLAFEQKVKNSIWLGLNAGVVYAKGIVPARNATFLAEGEGYVVRAYITVRNLFTYRENIYISGLLMYKKLTYDNIWTGYGATNDVDCTKESGNKYASGLRILFGFTPLFPKIFVFDMYVGLGANYEIVKRNIHNEGIGGDCSEDYSAVDKTRYSKGFVPSLHAGLNIGIGW